MADRTARGSGRVLSASLLTLLVCVACMSWSQDRSGAALRAPDIAVKLGGFDAYMRGVLRDWKIPGIGVGIIVDDTVVLAHGYGYRDNSKKLPFTFQTLFPIGSNTKLFTAVAAGLLVRDGKLTYDHPIRQSEPSIEFYNDALNNQVTLRDMLSHRTGITRHDTIWYKTSRSAEDLYGRLRYLEPAAPLREKFLYNNLMYAAIGRIIEIKSGTSYRNFIQQHILEPLDMHSTVLSLKEMQASDNYALPYDLHRNSTTLYQIPYYDDLIGLQSAGAMISNVEDLSHWLIALMNGGRYAGRQVLPSEVIEQTLEPTIGLPNSNGISWTGWDLLNTTYGMARFISVYRGHLLTYHGGHIDGYRAQISAMPHDRIGVIVLVMGEHAGQLYDAVSYHIYERLLGMTPSQSGARLFAIHTQERAARHNAQASAGADRVLDTHPSHPLAAFVGDYDNAAYGVMEIRLEGGELHYTLNHTHQALHHFQYDRFDTHDDEWDGTQSVNFSTSPLGDIDKATMSLDESEAVFVRRAPTVSEELLERVTGEYETPAGALLTMEVRDGALYGVTNDNADMQLIPYKPLSFRVASFGDTIIEFNEAQGRVTGFTKRSASGSYFYRRR